MGEALEFLTQFAAASPEYLRWENLGLSPIALDLGFFQLRWYSLAYIAGIIVAWWYLLKLIAQPGAPMARRHADDLVFYVTLGILLGGRLGYVLFYKPAEYFANPADIIRVWDGGMSFHGGVIGVSIAIFYMAWRQKLSWLRIHDYIACTIPFGMFFGRMANFVNGELWGRPGNVPWAMIFPLADEQARHPSQLYQAGLEGLAIFVLLWFLFWKTEARYYPGRLVGAFLLGLGAARFIAEFFREPDNHLGLLWFDMSMGQLLTIPMLLGGIYLIATSKRRYERSKPPERAGADAAG